MKSFIKTTALSLLTTASLSFNFAHQAQALTNYRSSVNTFETQNQTIDSIDSVETIGEELESTEQTKELAYGIACETVWVDGMWVSCCADSDGYWACVY